MSTEAADDAGDATPLFGIDEESRTLLGLQGAPAFARRGQDVEGALDRLDARCRAERKAMLEMVRLRLRQWAARASGPETASRIFDRPIDDLWPAASAPEPTWAPRDASTWRLRAVGRDLSASVARFNRRWTAFLDGANLDAINRAVEHYNRYYVLEKECALRSVRLATQSFVPRQPVAVADLFARHPPLPVPAVL